MTNHDELVVYSGYQEEWLFNRLATEEEKAKLFEKIKEYGYVWNNEENRMEKLAKPTFKKGDRLRHKELNPNYIYEIDEVHDDCYSIYGSTWKIHFRFQDEYELVPEKFDTATLKPFDKVLVRNCDNEDWMPALFGRRKKCLSRDFVTSAGVVHQCIPYEGNEHLLGKDEDCDIRFKNWNDCL